MIDNYFSKKGKRKKIVLMSLPVEISLQCEVEVFVNALGETGSRSCDLLPFAFVHNKLWNFQRAAARTSSASEPSVSCVRQESLRSSEAQPLNMI